MKKWAKSILGAAGLCICALSWATGYAEVRKPEMFGTCLPWDGEALELKVPLEGLKFARARVWGKGMEAAKHGGSVSLSSDSMSKNQNTEGPGVLEVCEGSWVGYGNGCEGVSGSIAFDGPSSVAKGAVVAGRIKVGAFSLAWSSFALKMGEISSCGRAVKK